VAMEPLNVPLPLPQMANVPVFGLLQRKYTVSLVTGSIVSE
jgi:hypothetical protein